MFVTGNKLEREYFEWIYSMLFSGDMSYTRLLAELHQIPFRYTIPMDGNREADGINLRYRFGYELGYADYVVTECLDVRECSVLEMMTALAVRCEEIMERADKSNLTGKWFREMLCSLGLIDMDNTRIDISAVSVIVSRFLDREYFQNGKGGLFTVSKKCDMRTVEIWYQMQYWLDEKIIY